jgi:hypothetical protein
MTGKEFVNRIANGKSDIIQILLDILSKTNSRYCLIGGLAVNAYVEKFEHSVNITSPDSDLRIQLQVDPRYQSFVPNADDKNVLGYTMRIAKIEDVLAGKVWAYMDKTRRMSKRQKDLADIFRIIEKYPQLETSLPQVIREELEKQSSE